MIGRRFSQTCERLGLNARKTPLSTDLFTPPRAADKRAQLSLF
jgi:hypothetical protein